MKASPSELAGGGEGSTLKKLNETNRNTDYKTLLSIVNEGSNSESKSKGLIDNSAELHIPANLKVQYKRFLDQVTNINLRIMGFKSAYRQDIRDWWTN